MIYFIEAIGLDAVKIGTAKDDVALCRRIVSYITSCPAGVVLLGVLDGGPIEERRLHKAYSRCRIRGEWFRRSHMLLPDMRQWVSPYVCDNCSKPFAIPTIAKRPLPKLCGVCSAHSRKGRLYTCAECGVDGHSNKRCPQLYRRVCACGASRALHNNEPKTTLAKLWRCKPCSMVGNSNASQ